MAQMQFAWRSMGPKWREIDPQEAGEYLEDLYQKYGEHLTKEEILAAARAANSPLHKLFDWDENEAAEAWRRRQVALTLSQLVIKKNRQPTRTRAFVYVHHPEHKTKVYVSFKSAMGNPEMKRELIEQALRGLDVWMSRFGTARELRRVSRRVEQLQRTIESEYLAVLTEA